MESETEAEPGEDADKEAKLQRIVDRALTRNLGYLITNEADRVRFKKIVWGVAMEANKKNVGAKTRNFSLPEQPGLRVALGGEIRRTSSAGPVGDLRPPTNPRASVDHNNMHAPNPLPLPNAQTLPDATINLPGFGLFSRPPFHNAANSRRESQPTFPTFPNELPRNDNVLPWAMRQLPPVPPQIPHQLTPPVNVAAPTSHPLLQTVYLIRGPRPQGRGQTLDTALSPHDLVPPGLDVTIANMSYDLFRLHIGNEFNLPLAWHVEAHVGDLVIPVYTPARWRVVLQAFAHQGCGNCLFTVRI
jgi:hypothetical protein